MSAFEFDVVLTSLAEITDEQADALYEAGCDDGTPVSRDGMARVHFDREAASLEDAVRLVVSQVRAAGLDAAKVELDVGSFAVQ